MSTFGSRTELAIAVALAASVKCGPSWRGRRRDPSLQQILRVCLLVYQWVAKHGGVSSTLKPAVSWLLAHVISSRLTNLLKRKVARAPREALLQRYRLGALA